MGPNSFATIGLPINMLLDTATKGSYVPEFEYGVIGREQYDYYWIVIFGGIFSFTMAVGIGANDVANSFATSVGSKTLKMWQALVIAGFCEFFGAFLLGARVTDTIKSGIVNPATFNNHDDLLMFGMMCALISTTVRVF
jgi:sodium-dependent phosphate transporter